MNFKKLKLFMIYEIALALLVLSNSYGQNLPLFQNGFRSKGSASFGTTSNPNAKALLDMISTSRGILIPRMNSTARLAISAPPTALTVFDTSFNKYYFYQSGAWNELGSIIGSATSLDPSAVFEADSTTAGAILPRMSQAQRDAIPSPATGLVVFNTTTDKYNFYNGTVWSELGSGSGGGGAPNLISDFNTNDSNFELGTIGDWLAYANSAAPAPTTGTGGSPSGNITFVASGTAPIEGSFSALWTKSGGANNQGEGFSLSSVPVPVYLRGQPLSVGFWYDVKSGSYTSGDLGIYIYDQSNSSLIIPEIVQVPGGPSGTAMKFEARIPTLPSTALLRFIVHQASTTTNNFSLEFDKFFISPIETTPTIARIDSEMQPYPGVITAQSSNPSFGTVTVNRFMWGRIGDNMHIHVEFHQTTGGSSGSGVYLVPLPAGYQIDTNKTDATGAGNINVAVGSANIDAVSSVVAIWDTTHVFVDVGDGTGAWQGATAAHHFANSDVQVGLDFLVPIAGWQAGASISADYRQAHSAAKTPVGSGTYLQMTGNSVNLSPGEWDLDGYTVFNNAGPVSYTSTDQSWTAANGADTGVQPASLSSIVSILAPSNNGGTGSDTRYFDPSTAIAANAFWTMNAVKLRVLVTSTVNVYLVPFVAAGTPANAVVNTFIYAKKVAASNSLSFFPSEVYVDTPNGHGSSYTNIRRFSVVRINTGPDITYVDDASNGDSFTINTPGVYSISYGDYQNGGTNEHGVSVNTSAPSTNILALTFAQGYRGQTASFGNQQNQPIVFSTTLSLQSGDVVRPHDLSNDNTSDRSFFNITRVR